MYDLKAQMICFVIGADTIYVLSSKMFAVPGFGLLATGTSRQTRMAQHKATDQAVSYSTCCELSAMRTPFTNTAL